MVVAASIVVVDVLAPKILALKMTVMGISRVLWSCSDCRICRCYYWVLGRSLCLSSIALGVQVWNKLAFQFNYRFF
jgi:hypothetical protein